MNKNKIKSVDIICKDRKSKEIIKIRDIKNVKNISFNVKIGVVGWKSNYCRYI